MHAHHVVIDCQNPSNEEVAWKPLYSVNADFQVHPAVPWLMTGKGCKSTPQSQLHTDHWVLNWQPDDEWSLDVRWSSHEQCMTSVFSHWHATQLAEWCTLLSPKGLSALHPIPASCPCVQRMFDRPAHGIWVFAKGANTIKLVIINQWIPETPKPSKT